MAKEIKTDSPAGFRIRQRDNRATEKKTFWIPQDISIELKVHCARNNTDASEVVSKLLADYLNEVDARKGTKRLLP